MLDSQRRLSFYDFDKAGLKELLLYAIRTGCGNDTLRTRPTFPTFIVSRMLEAYSALRRI